jgi:hypothetical protein
MQQGPALRWGSPVLCHILGDRGLAKFDAEFEEFSMDPGGVQHFPVFSSIFSYFPFHTKSLSLKGFNHIFVYQSIIRYSIIFKFMVTVR